LALFTRFYRDARSTKHIKVVRSDILDRIEDFLAEHGQYFYIVGN
jgi:hypothetical protein